MIPILTTDFINDQPTKALAIGLAGAVRTLHDDPDEKLRTFNRIVVKETSRGLDGYYWIYLQRLMNLNAEVGIDLKGLMNTTLQQLTSDYAGEDIVETILTNTATTHPSWNYHIVVPFLDKHIDKPKKIDGSLVIPASDWGLLENNKWVISYIEEQGVGYPIDAIGLDKAGNRYVVNDYLFGLQESISESSLLLTPEVALECYIGGDDCEGVIRNCSATMSDCVNCIETPIGATLPSGNGQSLQDHELTIELTPITSRNDNIVKDECEMEIIYGTHYATLKALPNEYNYYERLEESSGPNYTLLVRKLENPLRSGASDQGHTMILCRRVSRFGTWDEGGGVSMGGVYRVSQWGLPPLYFVLPFGGGFWFRNGPDLYLYYGHQKDRNEDCSAISQGRFDVDPYYEFKGCEFCDRGARTLQVSSDIIATPDYSVISDYWKTPSVTIGIGGLTYGSLDYENIRTIRQGVTTMQPIPPTNIGVKIGDLIKKLKSPGSKEVYEIKKKMLMQH